MVEQSTSRSQLREKLLLGLVYGGFFVLVFVVSLYWTFPYDRLRDFAVSKLSNTDGVTTRTVEIGELTPIGLGGVRVQDLELTQSSTAPDAEATTLHLSEVTAKLSLWSLLWGDKKLALEAKAGGGTLNAQYLQGSDSQHIEAELAKLDIGEMGLGSFVTLPLKGKASGTVDMTIPTDVAKGSGSVKLQITGLHIGDGKAKVKPPGLGTGLTLDEIDAGKLTLAVDLRDGVANVTRFATDGRDLKLSGKGTVHLADPLKRSRPDLNLDLTFSETYKNKCDRTKAMFEILGMRPEWQRATTPDGTMRVHVGGTFLAIRGGPGR